MISGIGVDNVELSRIAQAIQHSERFAHKVLTDSEFVKFDSFRRKDRQVEFLAGRWAAKEAFAKAYGTGVGSALSFQDLTIENDAQGKPYFTAKPFSGKAQLSISHSQLEAIAFVILEK